VHYSSVAWGDYNNDEYPDILLTGYNSATGQPVSKIYKNNGNNSFTEQQSVKLTGVYSGNAEWGDYDNDGDLDILLSGNSSGGPVSEIYRNDGSNIFIKQRSSSFTGVYYSKLKWADFDNDKDLDILLTGYSGTSRITKLYRNICSRPNAVPGPPRSLKIGVSGSDITFEWNYPEGSDETNVKGLSYNVRIGTSPGLSDIKTADANPQSGYRSLAGHGNVGHTLSWTIKNLPPGSYYWSVQTIDNGFLGSEFAAEQAFENYYSISGYNYTGSGPPYLGDYDRDGDLDILAGDGSLSEIYRNDISTGSGFTDMNAGLTAAYRMDGASAWGDYDNDGDLDIAHMGYGGEFRTIIFRNDNGSFKDINAGLQGAWMGTLAWIDYDNDGDLDLIIYGNHEFSDDGEPIGILY
ncbi:VCBS repeat-containing protein, partial [bacterium]|nr:VCBS repeat-containing protein [bacterium]